MFKKGNKVILTKNPSSDIERYGWGQRTEKQLFKKGFVLNIHTDHTPSIYVRFSNDDLYLHPNLLELDGLPDEDPIDV